MSFLQLTAPNEVIPVIISACGYFPNNPNYPLLIYRKISFLINQVPQTIQILLKQNGWGYSWIDGIYNYHHYHSNTHETLVIIAGECNVQIGGDKGPCYTVHEGDVVILPAGVAHKSLTSSSDFRCIGAYPSEIGCDMHYGKHEEYLIAVDQITKLELPEKDPIFGENGLMFDYWK